MASRNKESRFAQVPHINIPRARFKRDFALLTTINEGDLVPIYVDEVLPADTIISQLRGLIRMATPLYPVMDSCYLDTYAFFVPNRLLWEHWENFMGQNDSTFWAEKTEYSIPQTTAPSGGWNVGTIADYMGIPTGVENIKVNSLPFRAYARIWNEWFRDENLSQPVVQDTDDTNDTGSNTGTNLDDAEHGGLPLKVAKYHDYFTSCLPEPQKGDAVTLPFTGMLPVVTGDLHQDNAGDVGLMMMADLANGTTNDNYVGKISAQGQIVDGVWYPQLYRNDSSTGNNSMGNPMKPINLWAELGESTQVTINELRQAIAIQHILEADARGGTRYTEILQHQFGVTSPDSRLQRSEYLGGAHIPINVNQVIQQSATTEASPQGNVAAYSMTTLRNKLASYSATEHGQFVVLVAIRVEHSYQQGLSRMWTRKNRLDFYHPMLANLGEMAVLNQEIYAQGNSKDTEVFGYQEPWADYRYKPSGVTGEMRSQYAQSLDAWHYGDYYEEQPILSDEWIKEGTENIDRTLAVQSENSHQFICNFYFDQTWTRPMPLYGVPGLSTI